MTAASARCSTGIRFVLATVPLPTGIAWSVVGNRAGQPTGEIGVSGMKGQKLHHGSIEILDVFGLGLVTAAHIGFLPLGEPCRSSLGIQVCLDPFDGRCRCPHAFGEDLPALLLSHNPVISCRFDTAGQGSVTRRKENPSFRCGEERAIGGTDGVWGRARGEGMAVGHFFAPEKPFDTSAQIDSLPVNLE